MKKVVLVCSLWLSLVAPCTLAADESSSATPEIALEELFTPAPAEPLLLLPSPLLYCWDVEGTSCTTVGSTRGCTDVCSNFLTCTCRLYTFPNGTVRRLWDCQEPC